MKLTKDHHIQLLVHCARGQTILIGNDIAVRVNCTYLRKQDKRSCVSLTIEAPWETSIYQTGIDQKKPTISSAGNAWVPAENFLEAEPNIKQAASSAAQAGTESAFGVNAAQTRLQELSAQNALEASNASGASDTLTVKSNRAGMQSVKPLTTPQGEHPTLTVKRKKVSAAHVTAEVLA